MTQRAIDVHVHIGRTIAIDVQHSHTQYLKTMRSANIEQAILSPMSGGRQTDGIQDTMRENNAIAQAMREEPVRFPVGLATIEIRHEEKALEELERSFDVLGLRGLVFHAMFSGFFLGVGNVLDPLLDFANQREALCLMHAMPESGDFAMESPRAIGDLAGRYRDMVFVMGHPAITADQRSISIEAAKGRDNVYVDLAYQDNPETVEIYVRTLGPEHILFGSDAPFRQPLPTIHSVEAARISDDARERILYKNAADLIERYSLARASA
jgi:predicted TIM-barrel fold metal-dependent hydrolase